MAERSATEIIDEALTAAVLDAVAAWKASAGGLANVLARELAAVHNNTTAADLPREVQAALTASVRDTFKRLLKEGYVVSKASSATPASRPAPRPSRDDKPFAPRGPAKPPRVEVRRPKLPTGHKAPPKPR